MSFDLSLLYIVSPSGTYLIRLNSDLNLLLLTPIPKIEFPTVQERSLIVCN